MYLLFSSNIYLLLSPLEHQTIRVLALAPRLVPPQSLFATTTTMSDIYSYTVSSYPISRSGCLAD